MAAEPCTNPPPWIQTITGLLAGAAGAPRPASAGAQTFSVRQSSSILAIDRKTCARPCGQAGPNAVHARGCVHGSGARGGRHRSAPTGGAA